MPLIRIKYLESRIKLFFALILIALFLILPSSAFAVDSTPSAVPIQSTVYSLPSTVSPTSPLYTDLLVNNLFHSFSCLAIGQSVIAQPCLTYQVTKNAQGAIQSVPMLSSVNLSGGTLGAVTGVIGALYQNPPVRTADYLASVGQGLGIVKEANAQVVGSGAQVLNPIVKLWQVSRNISYIIMIIIFVIIGLMVMFRNRINPQTVITAQAALPGLVIGLIMITFSYFFAGLISDMAFVGTNVVGYYFAAAQESDALKGANLAGTISGESLLRIFGIFAGTASNQAGNALNIIIGSLPIDVRDAVNMFIGLMSAQLVAPVGGFLGPFSTIATPIAGVVGGLVGASDFLGIRGQVIKLVVVAILLYTMFRLLLRLINTYLTIIFLTLSAPFQFLFASLPGRQGIATGWIRSMLGNILAFPAVIAVFYFVAILLAPIEPKIKESDFPLKVSEINSVQNKGFVSTAYADEQINVINTHTFPLLGGMKLDFIRILLALGALIAVPAIPDIVIRAVGKASEAGQIIGQEIGAGVRGGQGYASQYASRATQTVQSIGTGITGESQWFLNSEGNLVRQTTKPGFWQAGGKIGGWLSGKTGKGGR